MSQRKDTGLNTNPWPVLLDHYNELQSRAMVVQQKTGQPVKFEMTKNKRESISQLIQHDQLTSIGNWFKCVY